MSHSRLCLFRTKSLVPYSQLKPIKLLLLYYLVVGVVIEWLVVVWRRGSDVSLGVLSVVVPDFVDHATAKVSDTHSGVTVLSCVTGVQTHILEHVHKPKSLKIFNCCTAGKSGKENCNFSNFCSCSLVTIKAKWKDVR